MTYLQELMGATYYITSKKTWKLSRQKNGVRKTFYGKTKKECAQKALEWLTNDISPSITKATTFDSVYQQFLTDKALETSDVYNIKNRYLNHIKPLVGRKPILSVTRQDLRRIITTAFRNAGLSKKSLCNLRGDLSGFCTYLIDANIRNDLTTRSIKIPVGAKRSSKKVLTPEGLYTLFHSNETIMRGKPCEDDLIYAYRFQLLYGLRPGELMGLQWGDIDGDVIHIRRALNAHHNITPGKNVYAERDLPITPMARELLTAQERYRTSSTDPEERVWGNYQQITHQERWKRYCKYNNIPYITPYELRHTFASINKTKLSVWALDTIMGHAHTGVTLGIYSHPLDDDMDGIVELLDTSLKNQIERGRLKMTANDS